MLQASASQGGDTQLLRSIAEQLKVPLAVIARQAELSQLGTNGSQAVDTMLIRTQAMTALTLVDSYLLGLQLFEEQTSLELEPVSISSTLVDVAHELDALAKQYDTQLELHIAGRYEPVMANTKGLRSALLTLGYALVEGHTLPDRRLTLAVHRTPHGIVTGIYGNYQQLTGKKWRQAMELKGQAAQPFSVLSSGSSAGIFVAQTILQAMTTNLRVGKHLKQYGLATTLQPSQQLQFV